MIRGRRGLPSHGYLRVQGPQGLREFDTQHCVHCQALIAIVGTEYQGVPCLSCGGLRCPACATCVPFMRKLDQQARRAQFARSAGLAEK